MVSGCSTISRSDGGNALLLDNSHLMQDTEVHPHILSLSHWMSPGAWLSTHRVRTAGGPGQPASQALYGNIKNGIAAVLAYSRLHDRFQFDDRRNNARVLVCMLAGYKQDLWRFVMPRFRVALPEADICIVTPGKRSEVLAELCRQHGWSYLTTATNDVSLAQNVCYRLHDAADMIVKLDEDMFLLPDTISRVLDEYAALKQEGVVNPGFVAPMIPLNGFCYRHLLQMLGCLPEYEAIFGIARLATSGLPVHNDPAAARWIWQHTAPLAATAMRLANMDRKRLLCPIQFSIGLIAFERAFWELISYLPVYRRRLLIGLNTLGGDEAYICSCAVEMSRPGVVTTAACAGHFSFGLQYPGMMKLLDEHPRLFNE
jgi:hypothetical protein